MSKKEMNVVDVRVAEETIEEKLARLEALEAQIKNQKGALGRKAQVLAILSDGKEHTIEAIGKSLGIKATNVSSQLTYLKSDGWAITSGTTTSHKKVLVDAEGKPRNLKIEKADLLEQLKNRK